MKKMKEQKVVQLNLDAGLFYDLAMKSLHRQQYDKALKYFRLAVEKEPNNPVNYCNLAGLLAELGYYEESSELLEKVYREIDPNLHECLFYLANNAANMEEYQQAEEYLLEYLSQDPDGEYAAEAEEMLYMLSFELGRPPREPLPLFLPDHIRKHEEARTHLEEGRFIQATSLLEEIEEEHPDFLPARNNLALAYYYLGQMDKARQKIEEVLEVDPNNLHALCNLAVLSRHFQQDVLTQRIIHTLKKLIPLQKDHTYKLATTMGILGQHEVAYHLFSRLIKIEDYPEASLYHYAAVSACNIGKVERAYRYWQEAKALDPDSLVPRFYVEQAKQWLTEPAKIRRVSYHYYLPFEELILKLNQGQVNLEDLKLEFDPLIQASCEFALQYGDKPTKFQVLHILPWFCGEAAIDLLREFLLKPNEEDELKQIALVALRFLKAKPPYKVYYRGHYVVIQDDQDPVGILRKWSDVWDRFNEKMQETNFEQQQEARRLWDEFVKRYIDKLDMVRKVEAWAAALEYVIVKDCDSSITQAKIADKYEVAPSSITRIARLFTPILEQWKKDQSGRDEE
jgi:tetratricopeptide (TPR) repeat protein